MSNEDEKVGCIAHLPTCGVTQRRGIFLESDFYLSMPFQLYLGLFVLIFGKNQGNQGKLALFQRHLRIFQLYILLKYCFFRVSWRLNFSSSLHEGKKTILSLTTVAANSAWYYACSVSFWDNNSFVSFKIHLFKISQ